MINWKLLEKAFWGHMKNNIKLQIEDINLKNPQNKKQNP